MENRRHRQTGFLRAARSFALAAAFLLCSWQSALAACSSPSGVAGQMVYNTDYNMLQYCNNTSWIQMGPTPYAASAVTFDGSSDYLTASSITGAADSTRWTGSFWVKRSGTGLQALLDSQPTNLSVDIDASSNFSLVARNTANTVILDISSTGGLMTTGVWHHVMFSVDLNGTGRRHIYVDGVSHLDTVTTYTVGGLIDFTQTAYSVGGGTTGSNKLNGDFADVWIDFGTYVDLSVPANRERFLSASGKPVNLGANGSAPFGSAPDIFMSGNAGSFATNKGAGGGFTTNGALTNASSTPKLGSVGGGLSLVGRGSLTNASNFAGPTDVMVVGNYAFVSSPDTDTFTSVDISNPDSPVIADTVTNATTLNNAKRFDIQGNFAYFAVTDGDRLTIVDISDPTNMVIRGSVTHASLDDAEGVAVKGSYAYLVSDDQSTFVVVNISNPDAPSYVTNLTDTGKFRYSRDVVISGNYAYTVSNLLYRMQIVDISTPTAPVVRGNINGSGTFNEPNGIEVSGTTVFVPGAVSDNLVTINAADPNSPAVADSITSATDLNGIRGGLEYNNGRLYVASVDGGTLTVLDVSDPTNISILTSLGGLTTVRAVAVSGNFAYTASDANVFRVIQIVDPDCTGPSGKSGQVNYNFDYRTPQFCNGGEWLSMRQLSAPTNGLVGYWKLDETSGSPVNSVTGAASTMNGGLSTAAGNTNGIVNKALRFDGTDDSINAGAGINLANNSFTVSVWARRTVAGVSHNVFGMGTGSANNGLHIGFRPTNVFTCSFYSNDLDTVATYTDSNWHLWTCTYDAVTNQRTIYRDSVVVAQTPSTGDFQGSGNAYIGANWTGASSNFKGDLDDMRIYSRPLTPVEVADLYYATSSGRSTQEGLIAHWPMNETSGTAVTSTAGLYPGTFSGNATVVSAAGKVGTALQFDGINDYISVSDAGFPTGASPRTFSVWFKVNDVTAERSLFSYGTASAGQRFEVRVQATTGDVVAAVNSHVWGFSWTPNTAWHHLAVVYPDGETLSDKFQLYFDGVLQSSSTKAGSVQTVNTVLTGTSYMGRNMAGSTFDLGQLDDVRLYNRALTAEEITTIYTDTNAGYVARDCTNPNGIEGELVYNASYTAMQYCNGKEWIRISGHGALLPPSSIVSVPVPASVALQTSATSTGANITIPAAVIAGDILVLFDRATNSSGTPSTVLPGGFNTISNQTLGTRRNILSYKLAAAGDASASITGMSGTTSTGKVLMVFRPDVPANTLTLVSAVGTIVDTDPGAQNITASTTASLPLIVVGGWSASAAVSPRTMSPAKDGEFTSDTQTYAGYKIYNTAPANVSIDIDDEGSGNCVVGGYIRIE